MENLTGAGELDFFYPDTFFINDLSRNQYVADLMRAIYVADFLADGNPVAREWFSSVAAVELFANDSTRQKHIDAVSEHVGELMSNTLFPRLLATGAQASDTSDAAVAVLEKKGKELTRTWELIQASPLAELGKQDASPETVMAARYAAMDKHDLGNAILCLDLHRLQRETPRKAEAIGLRLHPSRYDSVFREAVVRSETLTGVIVFDKIFDSIRDEDLAGGYATGVAEVRLAWSRWHSEDFYPAAYTEDWRAHMAKRTDQASEAFISDAWGTFRKGIERWESVNRTLFPPPDA